MIYSSWDIKHDRLKLVIFWPFTPLKTQKIRNLNFVGDIVILHMCTKNHNHMIYGSWYTEWDRQNILSFWAIFCPFTPLTTQKIKIKNSWRYHRFTNVCHKLRSYDVWFLRYKMWQTEFFVVLGHFLPFYPTNNPENQNFENMKKKLGDIIILLMCTVNDNHMMYGSWDMARDWQMFLSFWIIFYPSTSLTTKKLKFWKNEKKPGDIIILHMYSINYNHMMYGSWDMEHNG